MHMASNMIILMFRYTEADGTGVIMNTDGTGVIMNTDGTGVIMNKVLLKMINSNIKI